MNVTSKNKKPTLCHDMKTFVQKQIMVFLDFVSKTMDSDRFRIAMEGLLPFDQLLKNRLRFVDDLSPIKSMGVVVMKMEMEPARYALGIDVGFPHLNSTATRPIKFIAACKTNEELKSLVKSETITHQIEGFIIEQVKQYVESE